MIIARLFGSAYVNKVDQIETTMDPSTKVAITAYGK